jgi:hypothetical protein
MGLTQKLGTIPLAIFTDASNNIGIGGSPSGSYKFEVTGTARVSGLLTGANATFGSTGTGNNIIALSNNDQSNTRLRITNTGSGGQTFSIVGGNPGASNAGLAIFDETNSATRLYIGSTGNVGIGTSSPESITTYRVLQLTGAGTSTGGIFTTTTSDGSLKGRFLTSGGEVSIGAVTNSPFVMFTNDTERMRITTSGVLAISTTGKTWDSSYRALQIGDGWGMMAHDTNSDGYIISNAYYDGAWRISAQTNVRPSIFRVYDGLKLETGNSTGSIDSAVGTTNVFIVAINGNVTNLNNSYGQISDVSLKKDITPSTPKLDDLMKVNIVNFKFINDETEQKQIGVIAQELEEIFPSMIDIDADGLKSVKYSVFVPMLIKAIQELNAKVSALENKS